MNRGFSRRLLLGAVFLMVAGGVRAAVVGDDTAEIRPGQPIHQQFLDSGASVVTTAAGRTCMVSRRIGIEVSDYRDSAGAAVPFADIRRSPATSVQAGDGGAGAVWYRLQMKYPIDRARPVMLSTGSSRIDLVSLLEPSGDSLHLTGAAAAALTAAFAAGERPMLEGWSADTGHHVTDRLEAPDAAALAACTVALPTLPAAPILTNEVRVAFQGTPATAPLATLPDLKACGMAEPPGELRLVTLDSVTGFFSHTNRAFVAFAKDGAVARMYISGIFDADLQDRTGTARLSRAANANLPDAENDVKGCLGMAAASICDYETAKGGHFLADCLDPQALAGLVDAPQFPGGRTPRHVTGPLPPGPPGGLPPGGGPPLGGGTPTGGGGGGNPPPPPSPVPLPATGLLLIGVLGGLAALRRRRAFICWSSTGRPTDARKRDRR